MTPVQNTNPSPTRGNLSSTVITPHNYSSFEGRDLSVDNINKVFLKICKVDKNGHPLPTGKLKRYHLTGKSYDPGHLTTTFKNLEDRKPLEQLITTVLENNALTTHLQEENECFYKALAEHTTNGELPPRENWNTDRVIQTFTDMTWLNSLTLTTLYFMHR